MTHLVAWKSDAGKRMTAGMTLVEMLVSLVATLLLLGIVAQLFSMVGKGVNGSRNAVEMADGLRAVQYKLRQDFAEATALGISPPVRPEANVGYFELIEGPDTDRIAWYTEPTTNATVRFDKDSYFVRGDVAYTSGVNVTTGSDALRRYVSAVGSDDRLVGDTDDVLLMTVHDPAEPFVGRLDTTTATVQSPCAEVVWFCRPVPNTRNPRLFTLYRRQRLVMNHPGASPFIVPADLNANVPVAGMEGGTGTPFPNTAPAAIADITDVSCHIESGRLVPNTLGDLTKRECRFLRSGIFPYVFDPSSPLLTLGGDRLGEDIVLTNVISFDVRVMDRDAVVRLVDGGADKTGAAVTPGEAGWDPAISTDSGLTGAFVDLNWRRTASVPGAFATQLPKLGEAFSGLGLAVRNGPLANLLQNATYDTWSTHYEGNGLDDDGVYGVDQGMNGIDDNANGRIDEPEESETQPPYPTRLRGIEVRIRCYEPASRQIRQTTIRQSM